MPINTGIATLAPTAVGATTPLYESLTADSTADQLVSAYTQFTGVDGGTQANREASRDYPLNLGIATPAIDSAIPTSVFSGIASGTAQQKADLYSSLLSSGYSDQQIRGSAEQVFGTQADSDWSYLQQLAAPKPANTPTTQAPLGGSQHPFDILAAAGVPQADIATAFSAYNVAAGPEDRAYAKQSAIEYLTNLGVPTSTVEPIVQTNPGYSATPKTGATFLEDLTNLNNNPSTTKEQVDQLLAQYESDPAFVAQFGPQLKQVRTSLDSQFEESAKRWSTGDKHWTEGVTNFLAADKVYNQLDGMHKGVIQSIGKDYWAGQGFGSTELNTKAFTADLIRQGVTDLRDLTVQEVPIILRDMEVTQGEDGLWYPRESDGYRGFNYGPAITDPATIQELNQRQAEKQRRIYSEGESPYADHSLWQPLTIDYNTGRVDTQLINSRTGERVGYDTYRGYAQNYDLVNLPQPGAPIKIGETYKGKGATDFYLVPKKIIDEQTGQERTVLLPATQGRSTSDGKEILGGVLTIGSFIPGVAPFAAGANALLKASEGDYLGAALSAFAATPGIASALDMPLSASTASTLKNVGGGLNVANSLAKGDYLGAIAGAGNMVDAGGWKVPGTEGLQEGGIGLGQVSKGVGALGAIAKGDYLGGLGGLAGATGWDDRTIPGTTDTSGAGGFTVNQLLQGAEVAQDLTRGNLFGGIAGGLRLAGLDKTALGTGKDGKPLVTADSALKLLSKLDKITR